MAVSFTKSNELVLGSNIGTPALLLVEGNLVVGAGDTNASGAAAGDLPASLFSLKRIISALSIVKSTDNKAYRGGVASDGSLVVIGQTAAITDASITSTLVDTTVTSTMTNPNIVVTDTLIDLPAGTYALKLIGILN